MNILSNACTLVIVRPKTDFRSRMQFRKLMKQFEIWAHDSHIIPIDVIEERSYLRAFFTGDDAVQVCDWFYNHSSIASMSGTIIKPGLNLLDQAH